MLRKLEVLDIEGIKDEGTGFFVDTKLLSITSSINFKSIRR
jgi:hypothetical protein